MSKNTFRYDIHSDLPVHPECPAALGMKFVDTLDALSRIDPVLFANWEIPEAVTRTSWSLADARQRMSAIIESNAKWDEFGPPLEPTYTMVAYTGEEIASRRMTLHITADRTERGRTSLEAGDPWTGPPDPAIVTYPVFKAALCTIVDLWPSPWACAYAFRSDYGKSPLIADQPLFPYSRFHIPWIGYLSAPLTRHLSVPAAIVTELVPDGGLLMSAAQERLDPTNPAHLQSARILADILIKATANSQRSKQ
jgi:hypothetical protein